MLEECTKMGEFLAKGKGIELEDLVAETMLCIAKEDLRNYDPKMSKPITFIYAIMKRKVIDFSRKKRQQKTLDSQPGDIAYYFDPVDSLTKQERIANVAENVSGLSLNLQEAVLLRHLYGNNRQSLQTALDINYSTLGSRIRLALTMLRNRTTTKY